MKLLSKALWRLLSVLGGEAVDLEKDLTVVLRGAIFLLLGGGISFVGLAFLNWANILGRFGISVSYAILAVTALPALGLMLLVIGYPAEFFAAAFFHGGRKFFSRLMKWLTIELVTGINLWFVSASVERMIGVVILFFVVILIAAMLARASVWAMTAFLACMLLLGLLFYGGRDKVREAVTTRAQNALAAGKEKVAKAWEERQKHEQEERKAETERSATPTGPASRTPSVQPIAAAAVSYQYQQGFVNNQTLECGNEDPLIVPSDIREATFIVPPCRCYNSEVYDCARPLKLVNPEGHWQMRIGNPYANPNMPYVDQCELFFKYRSGREPVGTRPGTWRDVGGGCGNPNKPIDITYVPEGSDGPMTLHAWNPDGIKVHNLTNAPIVVRLWQE